VGIGQELEHTRKRKEFAVPEGRRAEGGGNITMGAREDNISTLMQASRKVEGINGARKAVKPRTQSRDRGRSHTARARTRGSWWENY